MRKFEKISFEEFKKSIKDDKALYDSYELPKRHSSLGAGYDFELVEEIILKPKEIIKVPTGIKACMNDGEMLLLIVRSSTGFKYNVRLTNQVGVLDADYYNNEDNEGHIFASIQNQSDKELIFNKKDRLFQGIFTYFLKVDDEEKVNIQRKGGLGSTNERKN